jgi:hypothetical protein
VSASLKAKIAEVFDEPGCDKNQAKSEKERRSGCTKQLTPGAAAGGCAFDGAKIALQPIVDVAHLVHGPIACEGNSWDNRHSASSSPQIYRTGFTTDINRLDVDMTPREMYAMLRDPKADIMLSGGRSQFVALKARMPWMRASSSTTRTPAPPAAAASRSPSGMAHPLRPSAAPSRGPSPDTKGPADLSCLARGRATVPGAACKAHRRTGKAGSAVAAWLRSVCFPKV